MGRPKSKPYDEQLKEKYGDKVIALEPYITLNTKILHRCNKHNYEYMSTPSSVLHSKHGCPICGEESHKSHAKDRMSFQNDEEYKKELIKVHDGNIDNLENYGGMCTSILHICHRHNYKYTSTPYSVLHSNGCKYCGGEISSKKQLMSFDVFKEEVNTTTNGSYELLSYSGMHELSKFKHICKNGDIHYFETYPTSFRRGTRCYCESNAINSLVVGFNDIATKRPDLVPLLYDENDAIKYTPSSKEKIRWICPDCGSILVKSISDVNSSRLSCNKCSDGISYPNKFMFNSLFQINDTLDFLEREFSPDWCNYTIKKKNKFGVYDIYFGIDGKQYIIEMDGGFHNRERDKSKLSLEEIKLIDKKKDELAIKHGINIIRIDCDYPFDNRFEFIKENIIKSELSNIIDLHVIDFELSNKEALASYIIKSADLWNNGNALSKIMETMHISDTTVRSYLKQATKIGICNYTPGDGTIRRCKKVIRIDTLQIYDSITLAANETNSCRTDLGKLCNNKRKEKVLSHKENKRISWMYYEDYLESTAS